MENLIDRLRAALPTLSRREASVAEAVLAEPEDALRSSIGTLAARVGVSQPTVIRLCRSIGCDGYADFKLKLAQSLGPGTPFVSAHVAPGDSASSYVGKILDAGAAALHAARSSLDIAAVEAAVGALANARRIVFFGLGGSAPTAADAAHKFSRFPIPSQAVLDPLLLRMQLVGMTAGDVVLIVSNTGRTREIVDIARLAQDQGVTVIAITAPASPLAQRASIVIATIPAEDAELFTPMASRLVHLAMIDVLATGVALRQGPDQSARLSRIKDVLRPTRLPGGAEGRPEKEQAEKEKPGK